MSSAITEARPISLDRYAVSDENVVLVVRAVQAAVLSPTALRSASRVSHDLLIQPIKTMSFLLGETRVRGDGGEQAGSKRGVDAFEEFQKEHAEAIALWQRDCRARLRLPIAMRRV